MWTAATTATTAITATGQKSAGQPFRNRSSGIVAKASTNTIAAVPLTASNTLGFDVEKSGQTRKSSTAAQIGGSTSPPKTYNSKSRGFPVTPSTESSAVPYVKRSTPSPDIEITGPTRATHGPADRCCISGKGDVNDRTNLHQVALHSALDRWSRQPIMAMVRLVVENLAPDQIYACMDL
jgi:hypothetical protein